MSLEAISRSESYSTIRTRHSSRHFSLISEPFMQVALRLPRTSVPLPAAQGPCPLLLITPPACHCRPLNTCAAQRVQSSNSRAPAERAAGAAGDYQTGGTWSVPSSGCGGSGAGGGGPSLPLLWKFDFKNDLGFPVTSSPALPNQSPDPRGADGTSFFT